MLHYNCRLEPRFRFVSVCVVTGLDAAAQPVLHSGRGRRGLSSVVLPVAGKQTSQLWEAASMTGYIVCSLPIRSVPLFLRKKMHLLHHVAPRLG